VGDADINADSRTGDADADTDANENVCADRVQVQPDIGKF